MDGHGACARALEALDRPHSERVLIGEIGVFGFENARRSLLAMARETGAGWPVIPDIALERNA